MKRVRFDDVVKRANTKEDRFHTDLLYYVGGEHIDSEDPVVHNRGLIKGSTIGPMFYFGFKKGQILFVSRNPHLRKCAQAGFDGICSEKTFVLETKDENVLSQRYLVWVMQTNDFWDYCEENKSGSINFFINWSTLAEYEFDLPDIEEQNRLADLLWAAYDLKESYKRLLVASDELAKSRFIEMFASNQKYARLKNVCIKGPQNGFYRKGSDLNGTVPIMKMKQLFGYESMSDVHDCDNVSLTPSELERFSLTSDDLLFGRRSLVAEGAGKCRRVGNIVSDMVFESSLLRVTLDVNQVKPRYLQMWFDSEEGRSTVTAIRSVTTIAGIKGSDLANIMIPVPSISEQNTFLTFVEQLDKSKSVLQKSIDHLDVVIKNLQNKTLTEGAK